MGFPNPAFGQGFFCLFFPEPNESVFAACGLEKNLAITETYPAKIRLTDPCIHQI